MNQWQRALTTVRELDKALNLLADSRSISSEHMQRTLYKLSESQVEHDLSKDTFDRICKAELGWFRCGFYEIKTLEDTLSEVEWILDSAPRHKTPQV